MSDQEPAEGPAQHVMPTEPLPEDDTVAVDTDYDDSAYGSEIASETTSINSSIFRGYVENGRRYQTLREDTNMFPSDEKQFSAMEASHLTYIILDSQRSNPLFRSPLPENAQHILDIGTGDGAWVVDVADRFPNVTVHGIDLYPPPETYVPPNAIMEIDDLTKEWTWKHKFDLIHIRALAGTFNSEEWEELYKKSYEHLAPGGYIEHVEPSVFAKSDDDSLPADSPVASWGQTISGCCERSGRPLDTNEHLRERIEAAGFVNIKEQSYKIPIGPWPSHPVYKDAGKCNAVQWKSGLEGYLLTRFGEPTPWSPEEVMVYVAKVRADVDKGYHIYQTAKRVWAQKPIEQAPPAAEKKVEVENLVAESDEDKPHAKKQKISSPSPEAVN